MSSPIPPVPLDRPGDAAPGTTGIENPPAAPPAPAAATPAEPYRLSSGLAYAAVALLLGLTQSLGINLVNSNLPGVQGALGATSTEIAWLTTAYYATNISGILLLTKVRFQFGLLKFADWAIGAYMLLALAHLFAQSLPSAILVRAALGLAAAPLNTLTVFYFMQAFPTAFAPVGLLLGFGALQLGLPLSRVLSEDLLMHGQWRGLNMLDLALATLSLAAINVLRLKPVVPQKVFSRGDAVSFPLYAIALALLCVVFTQGRAYWWTDTPWLGWCLAGAVACLGLYAIVERHRRSPLIDLRWVFSPFMLRFIASMVVFRVALVEQSLGAVGLMNTLGFTNDQMHLLFGCVTLATLAGFLVMAPLMRSRWVPQISLVALVLIIVAAMYDGRATVLTRPGDLFFSQTLLGLALALFFSCAVIIGFGNVIAGGMKNLVSFIAVFSATQPLASLAGTAWLSSLVYEHQRLHYAQLSDAVQLSDPLVAERVSQLSGSLASTVTDPGARLALGVGRLAQQVAQQAAVIAYNDLFHTIALFAAAGLLVFAAMQIWLALQRRRPAGALPSAS